MFFKRIEMTGFKSFATKTVVDLQPGVTIVVGPNGCGKSNIFDAIRWVLGEQSAKSLRGTKMGDVIFSGSATYKPIGCAQVTIVVDNEGGRLPIDFSEVSITRRLYRSGESEYLLNKTPCRLRDLQELFLDTGVGTESYSIMEQGRVDEIVKSKPEERRALFEEAAGIAKYKARKAEAMRKLEKTEHDLIRLDDRVSESRTRTNSLKRQASKAERYKELQETHTLIEKKLLSLNLSRFSQNYGKVEEDYRKAKARLDAARAKSGELETRREELRIQEEEADQLLQDLSIQREDQRNWIQEIERDIYHLKSSAETEKRRAEDYLKQVDEQALLRDEQAENLAEIRAEECRMTLRRIGLEAELNLRQAEFERMKADTDSTRRKIRETRKQMEDLAQEERELENAQTRLQMQLDQANAFRSDYENQRRELALALEQLDGEIQAKREEVDSANEAVNALSEKLGTSQNEGREALRARDVLRQEHRQAERELHESESRLRALERLAGDYEGYYQGVKSVMQAAGENQLDGVVGVVPELIQSIDPAHDIAIEVALGNHTQDVVVRTDNDAKRAIQFLKQNRAGQATFLPLNVIDGREGGREIDDIIHRPGIVGIASRLVAYDSYIEKAVFNLLGRTVVTDTVDISMQLVRQGKRNRYVSLEGELTFPSGAMTGGSRRQSQIMSRQREITELNSQAEEARQKVEDLERRIKNRENSILNLDAACTKMREEVQEKKNGINRLETELSMLRDSRQQRQNDLETLDQRANSSEGGTAELKNRLEEKSQGLSQVQATIAQARQELALMEDASYERDSEESRLNEELNQQRQEIAHLSASARHLGDNANSMVQQLQNLSRRATQLINDRQRALDAARTYLEQVERQNKEKEELDRDMAGIEDRRKEAFARKEKAQLAAHEINQTFQTELNEFNTASNSFNEIQAAYVNAEANLRQLKERAQELFHMPAEDIQKEIGEVEEEREELMEERDAVADKLDSMGGNINMGALVEYEEEKERLEFLTTQQNDLMEARESLQDTIARVDKTSRQLFHDAFQAIRNNFIEVYRNLFGGGKADLVLKEVEDGDPLLDGGIDIIAQPPGKKLQNVSLLSGGEKALTAVSLMFAIFLYKPSPFCVMDEIDAPLDDANVLRLREMLRSFSEKTQFVIITHNKITMELGNTIYGVTMQETGVSSMVSVSIEPAKEMVSGAS